MSAVLDFAAGKYAVFVWPAYAISALVFGVLIAASLGRARHWRREVERRENAVRESKP